MNVPLTSVRNMDIWQEVQQPKYCYHYSTKENIDKILKDGKIKQFDDYMTYFFYNLEDIPAYFEITGAYHGRKAYNTKGQIITYPPIVPSEYKIIKVYPARQEPLKWYEERTQKNAQNDKQKELLKIFDSIRVCHYGDLLFKKNPEVIELSDVVEKYSDTAKIIRIREIKKIGICEK